MKRKRVRITDCSSYLRLAKAIMNVTGKDLRESVNIVTSVRNSGSILLLNESSITPEEWEDIANWEEVKSCIKWEYV